MFPKARAAGAHHVAEIERLERAVPTSLSDDIRFCNPYACGRRCVSHARSTCSQANLRTSETSRSSRATSGITSALSER